MLSLQAISSASSSLYPSVISPINNNDNVLVRRTLHSVPPDELFAISSSLHNVNHFIGPSEENGNGKDFGSFGLEPTKDAFSMDFLEEKFTQSAKSSSIYPSVIPPDKNMNNVLMKRTLHSVQADDLYTVAGPPYNDNHLISQSAESGNGNDFGSFGVEPFKEDFSMDFPEEKVTQSILKVKEDPENYHLDFNIPTAKNENEFEFSLGTTEKNEDYETTTNKIALNSHNNNNMKKRRRFYDGTRDVFMPFQPTKVPNHHTTR